jgi:cytochrome b
MVLALLALLLVQAMTGLFANDQIMASGPLYGYVSSATSDQLTSVHKKLFDLLLVAIGLHVGAALFYLFFKRENLILPMLVGTKAGDTIPPQERIANSRAGLWALIVALVGGVLYLVVRTAPEASMFSF